MKRVFALILAFILVLGLAACGVQNPDPTPTPTPVPAEETPAATYEPTEAPAPEVDSELAVNVMVLNGTTGFGMAKLMADADAGEAALNYAFSVETDASNVTAALISGACDIAALPTNAAATVYNKTEGGVQLLALNTLGVLYLVVNTGTVTVEDLADLEGMTVYVPAQNPTFLFKALCQAAEVDVTIDNTYAQPADLRTALAAGDVDVAVLPEPMVTMACATNKDLSVVLDLTTEWDAVYPAGSLVQGCVVARTEFVSSHPAEVDAFLAEYGGSIAYLEEAPADAAQIIAQTGVLAQADVAEKAIPNCNICFITGEEMKTAMNDFLSILFDIAPDSIGGALPDDDFYYIAE